MYTSQSHVLNCELYKVMAMKIKELHSTVVGAEVINKLRLENKFLRSRLAVFEDARTKFEYKINMAKIIRHRCEDTKIQHKKWESCGKKEDILSQPLVPRTVSVPVATVPLVPKAAMGVFSTVPLIPEVIVDISFALPPEELLLP
ncbi:hypothetical protein Fot_05271 [Forsythia ovata]|uniref:Uncharacterized protein n=1 Tax=Forsythia ovata TaxID=205694 RepID=A0ABD1WPN1_9LAMI